MLLNTDTQSELALTGRDWTKVVRGLVSIRSANFTATLHSICLSQKEIYIVEPELRETQLPQGSEFAPFAQWLVVAMVAQVDQASPQEWITRLKPLLGQTCVILLLGAGLHRGSWRGWVIRQGKVCPLDVFRIAGPQMLKVSRLVKASASELVLNRASRTAGALTYPLHARILDSSIALIGCSRSGTLAGAMFAALGVRRLALIDGDRIEPHNLDGMVLATEADIGKSKSIALGERLVQYRSELTITAANHNLSMALYDPAIGDADLIVTCVDQDAARLSASRIAHRHLIPHLDIGTSVRNDNGLELVADVRLLLPASGCVRCVGGINNIAIIEESLRRQPGSLSRFVPETFETGRRAGSLITLNSMAVSTGIQSWLDLLAGRLSGSIWHRIRWQPGGSWEIQSAIVDAATECPECRTRK